MSSPVDEVLEDIFHRLANKWVTLTFWSGTDFYRTDEVRIRAADDLRVYVCLPDSSVHSRLRSRSIR